VLSNRRDVNQCGFRVQIEPRLRVLSNRRDVNPTMRWFKLCGGLRVLSNRRDVNPTFEAQFYNDGFESVVK